MKKKIVTVLGIMSVAAMLAAGCGKTAGDAAQDTAGEPAVTSEAEDVKEESTEAEDVKEESTEAEDTKEEEAATAEDVSEEAEQPAAETVADGETLADLPAYEYPGPEEFYNVLYTYLCDELGKGYDDAQVGIPCPIIVAMDDRDLTDIKLYGDFWYFTYDLNGDVLENKAGGSYPGCIHIKGDDTGYTVTDFEVVEDGSNYTDSCKKIFGDHFEAFTKSNEDTETRDKIRAQIIANYVAANNLSIRAFQDFGWDPVELPPENIDNFYSSGL